MEKYAQCCICGRWLELECFERIEDYSNGHILPGGFHHKVACITCLLKAIEASEQMLEEAKTFAEKPEETYNGVPVSEIKVSGTD